jgi:hypothetical protein
LETVIDAVIPSPISTLGGADVIGHRYVLGGNLARVANIQRERRDFANLDFGRRHLFQRDRRLLRAFERTLAGRGCSEQLRAAAI